MAKFKFINQHCVPCNGNIEALPKTIAQELLESLAEGWLIDADGKILSKDFIFKDSYQTMSFLNAIAWIANQEGHHPGIEVGYARCRVRYTSHEINGLSTNDYICAAKIDAFCATKTDAFMQRSYEE